MDRHAVSRSLLSYAAAAAALTMLLGAPAFAEVAKAGRGVTKAEPLERAPRGRDRAAKQETVSGTILSTDPTTGTARVKTRAGIIELRARPGDAALLRPGQKTTLPVERVGEQVWMGLPAALGIGSADVSQQPGMGGSASTLDSAVYQQRGRATGAVTDVDREKGTFTVDGRTFTAHPAHLRTMKRGQAVTVDFGVVGESGWADRVTAISDERSSSGAEPEAVAAPDDAPAPSRAPVRRRPADEDSDE